MAANKLERTSTPRIFRRHAKDCTRAGRCECAYVSDRVRGLLHRVDRDLRRSHGPGVLGDNASGVPPK